MSVAPMIATTSIAAYCSAKGMSFSRFGRLAANDPCLVDDMLKGRALRPETAARVAAFMEGRPLPTKRARIARRLPAREPHPLLDEVLRFLAECPMTPTEFGIAATGQSGFVGRLRGGRIPTARTIARVRHYIEFGED